VDNPLKKGWKMYLYSQRKIKMITLIAATNRPRSFTRIIANNYSKRMTELGVKHSFFSLEDMPQNMINNSMYSGERLAEMVEIQNEFLIPANKFIFIIPEYNGSYPGVLKAFIDASDIKNCWQFKKAALVGVSDGRAGNLRGMDDFTNVLNHMKINVLHMKIPISSVSLHVDEAHQVKTHETLRLMDAQIQLFSEF
jgi:NAD(P)H-dependent FMN reductase